MKYMKQNINIEAEGSELVLKNKAGDYVIIPKKYRTEVQGMIEDGCHSCIDSLVETLPIMDDYAEDGSLFPDWDKVKNKIKKVKNKIKATLNPNLNPKNWGVPDYTYKGSKGAAYAAAKRAGEKEFMWNNGRYNTDYDGTVEEEVKSYFPEYNVITGVEPGNLVKTALHRFYRSIPPKWPHVFTGDLNKKTAIDYPAGYNYSDFGVNAYDDTKYYASKINTGSIYDEISKMTENNNAGEYSFINHNCAGAVCDGLNLPYGKLPLPSTVPMKLKSKYPTIELTSNVTDAKELSNLYNRFNNDGKESLLNTNANTLEKHSSDKHLIKLLQDTLFEKGYKLPKSTKKDGAFDGIWGDETKNALLDYQSKNKPKPVVNKATRLDKYSKNQY